MRARGASLNNGPSFSNGPGSNQELWPYAWWHLVEGDGGFIAALGEK